MFTKTTLVVATIAAVVGIGIGYPLSTVVRPVKTVTKTVTKTQTVKIHNGESLTQVVKSFGSPAGVTRQASASDNYVACIAYQSRTLSASTIQRGDWSIQVCAKVQ